MPDARHPATPAPEDWSQAFAALPLETPPTGGWNRVATALPTRRSRHRFWIPAAAAACLALAMAVPWRGAGPDQSPPVAVSDPPSTVAPADAPATSIATSTPAPAPTKTDTDKVDGAPVRPASVTGRAPSDTGLATAPVRAATNENAPVRSRPANADPSSRRDATSTAVAKHIDTPTRPATEAAETTVAAGTPASPAALETLYAESARLEALLSQIRDDRVASGPAMALSAALNERVAGIDVALSQPELAADTRLGLWRERVAVLQRLTGVESTQRWMAANGYPTDGAVAQVY